jgi:uncharacterized protein YkwD
VDKGIEQIKLLFHSLSPDGVGCNFFPDRTDCVLIFMKKYPTVFYINQLLQMVLTLSRFIVGLGIVIIVCLSIFGCSKNSSPSSPEKTSPDDKIDVGQLEQKVYTLVNQHRTEKGLPPLEWSESVAVQCRIHSQNMASGEVPFGDSGFEERADSIRVSLTFVSITENVASNWGFDDPAQTAFDDWGNNSVHMANIEGAYDITGVGAARSEIGSYYFTQIFIRRE